MVATVRWHVSVPAGQGSPLQGDGNKEWALGGKVLSLEYGSVHSVAAVRLIYPGEQRWEAWASGCPQWRRRPEFNNHTEEPA